jgi:phospholipid/cholesterol/gamma-HCH transport system substrate-binding protein
MDLGYKQEIGVGALVLLGLALFVFGMFWLTGRSIRSTGVEARVVFTNVSGLKQGDPVMVSGVKKGRVARVDLERVGRVTVTLEVGSDVRPRLDATALVTALDFFGAKFIDYSPGSEDKDFLPRASLIVGSNPPGLTDIAGGLATRANELIGNATTLVSRQLGEDIHNTLVATQRGMNALAEMGGGSLVGQTTKTLAAAERMMARMDSLLASSTGERVDTISANLAALTDHLGNATASLDTLLGKMNRGEGSLGKVATDTALYSNLNATLTALTKLLDDLRERPGRYLTVKVF